MKTASDGKYLDYIAISCVLFSIAFFFLLAKYFPQSEIAIAVASIGIQIAAVAIQNFRNKIIIQETKDRLQELSNRPDLRLYGSMGQAELQHHSKLKKAKNIRNTFINLPENRGSGAHSNTIKNGYRTWYENGIDGSWEDVAGFDERNDDRFIKWKFSSGKSKKTHRLYLINSEAPFMNFCIIEYIDGTREVMFGWLPNMNSVEIIETQIFISDDINIVRTFEALFSRMKAASEVPTGASISH